ncbi:hypothetical protein B0H17DRAFT_1067853 [Mycena rosella]|uniref:Uncharacterized protein n=1 Tax=Mycena rosella TaxID=1033263 RepID=A0AAD7DD44_MYCRO|nr:hypothetical protein B0H17DRAFT_1067853 [Mycena rosella]
MLYPCPYPPLILVLEAGAAFLALRLSIIRAPPRSGRSLVPGRVLVPCPLAVASRVLVLVALLFSVHSFSSKTRKCGPKT